VHSLFSRLLSLFSSSPSPLGSPSLPPGYETESYYYALALEDLLRVHAIALPPKPAQCTIASCPNLATWSVREPSGSHLADYCDSHLARAHARLDSYPGLRWNPLPLTSYFRDYTDRRIIVLRQAL
jgi:hypothetical protein